MKLFHKIKISISGTSGDGSTTVLKGGDATIRSRRLSKLLGSNIGVLLLVPDGQSVSSVVVQPESNGGEA